MSSDGKTTYPEVDQRTYVLNVEIWVEFWVILIVLMFMILDGGRFKLTLKLFWNKCDAFE